MAPLDLQQALDLVYRSYLRAEPLLSGDDTLTRDPAVSARLFARLGLPRDRLPSLLVTGSKGKGSTALLSAAMLQGLGYRVGLVTSPHLVDFRERIRFDGQAIGAADYVRIMNLHADAIDELEAELAPSHYIGPNGIIFACAMRHFLEQRADVLVLEAGRGGRFDEVSLFAPTAVCLTPIMAEHLDKLGPTVAQVAWHKAGIIGAGATVASAPQPAEAAEEIARVAAAQGARLLRAGQEIGYEASVGRDGLRVAVEVPALGLSAALALRTLGRYQALNAALAATAATALDRALSSPAGRGRTAAPADGLGKLLGQLRLPGRCEPIASEPLVVVDGAINRLSAEQFLEGALAARSAPTVLITALPSDKDYQGLLEVLAPHVAQIIVTEADNPHLHFSDAVERAAHALHPAVAAIRPSGAAFAQGVELAGAGGTLWVVGTQSLVRDALRHWGQDLETIWA
jgi:dihydrofolate synthase / folylpolyglutamate synthase